MTAENHGTDSTPEGDDPFAYLYRQQGGDGSAAPQTGVPRRSYNQVRTVGERQYGGYGPSRTQQAQQSYQNRQPAYGQETNPHYAAPETMPGGRAAARQASYADDGGGYGGGRSRNGLLIGALAVVAAVVVGIGAAIYFNNGDSADQGGGRTGADAGGGRHKPGHAGTVHKGAGVGKKQDAVDLTLAGGPAPATDVPGALSANGTYVAGMNTPGASATWTTGNVPKAGVYTLFVRYGVPGEDADSTLTINGQPSSRALKMSNFGHTPKGDWAKGWTKTFAWVQLKQGSNDLKLSCEQGNNCNFNLDQVWLKAGKVKR